MADQYYTVQEVAEIFGFSDRTIRNWIKEGLLRAIQVRREYRIPISAVQELQRQEKEAAVLATSSR